jgi:hypothetical protein
MTSKQPIFVSVNGTGVSDPFGPGFDADIGRFFQINPYAQIACDMDGLEPPDPPPIFWAPAAFPAAVFPMMASVKQGIVSVTAQVDQWHTPGNPLFIGGYSQGAIVIGMYYLQNVLSPNGVHHRHLADLARGGIINFGDPLRAPGIANGNKELGFALPSTLDGVDTGGIGGPLVLHPEDTPDWYLSCALDGDLYASCPIGDNPWAAEASTGKVETSVYNFVESGSILDFLKIALDVGAPIGTVKAIYNALKFASAGMNAPHWQYGPFVGPAINWILSRI